MSEAIVIPVLLGSVTKGERLRGPFRHLQAWRFSENKELPDGTPTFYSQFLDLMTGWARKFKMGVSPREIRNTYDVCRSNLCDQVGDAIRRDQKRQEEKIQDLGRLEGDYVRKNEVAQLVQQLIDPHVTKETLKAILEARNMTDEEMLMKLHRLEGRLGGPSPAAET